MRNATILKSSEGTCILIKHNLCIAQRVTVRNFKLNLAWFKLVRNTVFKLLAIAYPALFKVYNYPNEYVYEV